jgi:DNA-binding transcriptional MerR regulator
LMSDQSTYRPPQDVARELEVSPATLRRWSDEFAEFLSSGADSAKGKSHRRYTESDITTLVTIKDLMSSGLTYDQVRQQLAKPTTERVVEAGSESSGFIHDPLPSGRDEISLVAADGAESPAIAFLTNTLMALSEGQKSILNSQAANRELMGVLIQDNFNLKEENNRLRERILELERNTAQTRHEEEWRRETLRQELDSKITAVQQLATQALTTASSVEMPEIKAISTKPGCLGALFGAGGTQIVNLPRRRPPERQEAGSAGAFSSTTTSQPASSFSAQRSSAAHPKPSAPPE